MNFQNKNNADRLKMIDKWSEYVMTHDDRNWSEQQNIIINSCMKTAKITLQEYLKMKQTKPY